MIIRKDKLATPYELTIYIDKDTLNKSLDEQWEKIKDSIEIDGFRKGKVPKKTAEEKVFQEMYKDVLPTIFSRELQKQDISIIYNFDVRMKGEFKRDNEITLLNKVYLFPDITLPTDFTYKFNTEEITADIDEVKAIIENLRIQGQPFIKSDKPAQLNDRVKINFTGYMDGKKFEGGEGKEYPLMLGSKSFVDGFEEQVVGIVEGEQRKIKVTFPKMYQKNLAGKEATFIVEALSIETKKKLEIEDLYTRFSVSNMNELQVEVADRIIKEKQDIKEKNKKSQVFQDYVQECKISPIPHEYIDQELDKHYQNSLEKMNISEEELDKKMPNSRKMFHAQQRQRVLSQIKSTFVIEEIIKKQSIKASDSEIDQYIETKYNSDDVANQIEVIEFNKNNETKRKFVESQIKIDKAMNYIMSFANWL